MNTGLITTEVDNDWEEVPNCAFQKEMIFHLFACVPVLVYECVCMCVSSITYVPAEYLEEYKASLEQTADTEDVFSDTAPAPNPATVSAAAPKYVYKVKT